jgi:hypothetical protein
MNKIVFMIGMALILLVPASALATTTIGTDFRVFVTVTNGNTIHDLNVKASQGCKRSSYPCKWFRH